MAKWEGKTRGGVLGYRIFVYLLKHFNLSLVYFVLRLVVLYYFVNSRKSFRAIYIFYHQALKLSPLKSFFSVYKTYYKLGQILLDKTIVLADLSNKFTYNFEGEEYLREISASGKGGILLGAHMGSWDMAGFLLKRLDYKVNIMIYDAEHRNVKEFLEHTYGGKDIDERVNFIQIIKYSRITVLDPIMAGQNRRSLFSRKFPIFPPANTKRIRRNDHFPLFIFIGNSN